MKAKKKAPKKSAALLSPLVSAAVGVKAEAIAQRRRVMDKIAGFSSQKAQTAISLPAKLKVELDIAERILERAQRICEAAIGLECQLASCCNSPYEP